MRRFMFVIATASLVSACASTKGFLPSTSFSHVSESSIIDEAPNAWSAEYENSGKERSVSWVKTFGDEVLEALVAEALGNNYNLTASAARLEQAEALARISNSARLPAVNLGAAGTGNFVSGAPNNESYSATVSASWELDVWGRVRDRAFASRSDAAAAQADFEALQLSLAGQIASAWVDLIAASQQEALAFDDVQTRKRSMGIVERRYKRGLSTSLDVRLARSAMASTEANLSLRNQQHGNATRRLEILLGRYPDHAIKTTTELPVLSKLDIAGSPVDILASRPDVRSSEQRMAAAGLRVADARKAILPGLTLSGSATTGGLGIGDIFDFNSVLSRLIGSVTQPVFRGGAIRADIARNEAAHRERLANYAQTVLIAWREVEDALYGEKYLADREASLQISVHEAKEAERLAEREYGRGVGTIFELLDAQRRRISAEGQLISASNARLSNRIALYLALGGDAKPKAVKAAKPSDEDNRT